MPTHVAFLRGMNLGGRRLTNDRLRAAFGAIGFSGVITYRASGNVLLTVSSTEGLVGRIEQGLEAQLGYPVPTVVRTTERVVEIAAFDGLDRRGADDGKLQVTMLRDAPDAATREAVLALATADDQLAFGRSELFWLPRAGVLETGLDLKVIDGLLGLGTMRTMGTIEALAKRCG